MQINRVINQNGSGYDFELIKGDKRLCIIFARVQDLYISLDEGKKIPFNANMSLDFDISFEDGEIFDLFDRLYSDIVNGNVFGDENSYMSYPIREIYNSLVGKDKSITWVSDEGINEAMDKMIISKIDEGTFRLTFVRNDVRDPYGFKNPTAISVRISNSGSRYDLFNCPFMKMYQGMHNIDVEEYNQKRTLSKETN